jgi:hypothetical protein
MISISSTRSNYIRCLFFTLVIFLCTRVVSAPLPLTLGIHTVSGALSLLHGLLFAITSIRAAAAIVLLLANTAGGEVVLLAAAAAAVFVLLLGYAVVALL